MWNLFRMAYSLKGEVGKDECRPPWGTYLASAAIGYGFDAPESLVKEATIAVDDFVLPDHVCHCGEVRRRLGFFTHQTQRDASWFRRRLK